MYSKEFFLSEISKNLSILDVLRHLETFSSKFHFSNFLTFFSIFGSGYVSGQLLLAWIEVYYGTLSSARGRTKSQFNT